MSWEMAADAASTRPETTARIVANATAQRNASRKSPARGAIWFPSICASNMLDMLPPLSTAMDDLRADIYGRTEAQQCRQDVESADDKHGDDDRLACRLGRRHSEETHENVRHTRGSQHQSHTQRNLIPDVLQQQPRFQETLAVVKARFGLLRL